MENAERVLKRNQTKPLALEVLKEVKKRANMNILLKNVEKGHAFFGDVLQKNVDKKMVLTIKPSTNFGLQSTSWLALLLMCFSVSLVINMRDPLRYTVILSN